VYLEKTWRWEFLAFHSVAEGAPVQEWFDSLPDDPDRYEIIDLLDSLQKTNDRLWPEKIFNPLIGAGGISEIRIPDIRCFRGGKYRNITYRIYGFFGPRNHPHSYTFLHGTHKNAKNDIVGKQIAKGRLDELTTAITSGTVSVRKFEFQKRSDSKATGGAPRPN
jgi:hypothetical protein